AKFANGVADDFLTSTYLASNAPVLVAPAMNTTMWNHPATQRNLRRLREDGVRVVLPDAGEMACGTFGPGRLSEPERIVVAALEILRQKGQRANRPANKIQSFARNTASSNQSEDLRDQHFLITSGATREPIDPLRFITNRSVG